MASAVSDPVVAAHNEGTRFADVRSLVQPPMAFSALFGRYFGEMRRLRAEHATPGYLVFSVFANEGMGPHAHLSTDAGLERSTLVIGRHSACSLCLSQDNTVALRHAVVRVWRDHEGHAYVKVVDLSTGQGFEVEGAGRCESAVSDGPLFLRAGSYSLFFWPTSEHQERWSTWPEVVWVNLPDRRINDCRRWVEPVQLAEPFSWITHITLLPSVKILGEGLWVQPEPSEVVGSLSLRDGRNFIERPLRADQLARGVLIGRYARCDLKPELSPAREQVSRVHLLLIREGEGVIAIDTASSNGSRCDGRRFDAIELGGTAVLSLGDAQEVRWTQAGALP